MKNIFWKKIMKEKKKKNLLRGAVMAHTNEVKNQKKFFEEKKIEIKVRSKSIEEIEKTNLQQELEKLDIKINMDVIMNQWKYFINFEGHIVVFEFFAADKLNEEKKIMLGIAFCNSYNNNSKKFINYNIMIMRVDSKKDLYTVITIIKLFFIEDIQIKIFEWKNPLFEMFKNIIMENSFGYVDINRSIEFHEFENLKDLLKFLRYFNKK